MIVVAKIVHGPLTREVEALARGDGVGGVTGTVGAVLRFEGIVRRGEACAERGGAPRDLLALEYQTYDPMAQRELEALARGVGSRHGLISIIALHSRGRVDVGEVSFVVEVSAPHRAATLAGVTEFIDRLKQDVPIWKRPVWAD